MSDFAPDISPHAQAELSRCYGPSWQAALERIIPDSRWQGDRLLMACPHADIQIGFDRTEGLVRVASLQVTSSAGCAAPGWRYDFHPISTQLSDSLIHFLCCAPKAAGEGVALLPALAETLQRFENQYPDQVIGPSISRTDNTPMNCIIGDDSRRLSVRWIAPPFSELAHGNAFSRNYEFEQNVHGDVIGVDLFVGEIEQGAPIGMVQVRNPSGHAVSYPLRAGSDLDELVKRSEAVIAAFCHGGIEELLEFVKYSGVDRGHLSEVTLGDTGGVEIRMPSAEDGEDTNMLQPEDPFALQRSGVFIRDLVSAELFTRSSGAEVGWMRNSRFVTVLIAPGAINEFPARVFHFDIEKLEGPQYQQRVHELYGLYSDLCAEDRTQNLHGLKGLSRWANIRFERETEHFHYPLQRVAYYAECSDQPLSVQLGRSLTHGSNEGDLLDMLEGRQQIRLIHTRCRDLTQFNALAASIDAAGVGTITIGNGMGGKITALLPDDDVSGSSGETPAEAREALLFDLVDRISSLNLSNTSGGDLYSGLVALDLVPTVYNCPYPLDPKSLGAYRHTGVILALDNELSERVGYDALGHTRRTGTVNGTPCESCFIHGEGHHRMRVWSDSVGIYAVDLEIPIGHWLSEPAYYRFRGQPSSAGSAQFGDQSRDLLLGFHNLCSERHYQKPTQPGDAGRAKFEDLEFYRFLKDAFAVEERITKQQMERL